MTNHGEPNSIRGDPKEKQQNRKNGQRLQQNSPLRDQYLLQQPCKDLPSAMINTFPHVFTKVNIDAPKPTDNIWIGFSHVFLPTFWCAKCDSWSSHHEKIHDERIRWQNMKDAQIAKQLEQRKQNQQNHYGPPQQQDRQYGQNDNNKRSNTAYGRDSYQDKRSRNDLGRSPLRDRSNSHTRSPRRPGDNHRNGASFYDDKKKY
jgi:hypothetical protein